MVHKPAQSSSSRNEHWKTVQVTYDSVSLTNQWWHFQVQELFSTPPKCPHTVRQNKRCSIPESELHIKLADDIPEHCSEAYTPVATSLKITFKLTVVNTEVIKVHQQLVYWVYYQIKTLKKNSD